MGHSPKRSSHQPQTAQARTVDVQLIISAGMNIASGPVCTAKGGPVFLADGFARTEVGTLDKRKDDLISCRKNGSRSNHADHR